MGTTRDTIINTTKDLFAERGYENVTLRDIAAACHISPGNLTYYFGKKEELVDVVVSDVYEELGDTLALITDLNVRGLLDRFRDLEETSERLSYYFRNMFSLARDYPGIANYQKRFREHLYYYYLRSFREMLDGGSLRTDIPKGQYRNLAVRMILVTVSWALVSTSPAGDASDESGLFENLSDSIYSYLSEQGIAEWNAYFGEGDEA